MIYQVTGSENEIWEHMGRPYLDMGGVMTVQRISPKWGLPGDKLTYVDVTWSARTHLISQKSLQEHMHLKSFSVVAVLQRLFSQDAWQERFSQERK